MSKNKCHDVIVYVTKSGQIMTTTNYNSLSQTEKESACQLDVLIDNCVQDHELDTQSVIDVVNGDALVGLVSISK